MNENINKDELIEVPFDDNHTAIIPKYLAKSYLATYKMLKNREEEMKNPKYKIIIEKWDRK